MQTKARQCQLDLTSGNWEVTNTNNCESQTWDKMVLGCALSMSLVFFEH